MRQRAKRKKAKAKNYTANLARLIVCFAVIGATFAMFCVMIQPDIADTFKGLMTIPFAIFIIIAWSVFDIINDQQDSE